jgi:membrane protein implicated in regulation of membrane protease activity
MIWMGILMGLPVLGLALFSVYPWQEALPSYLALTGVSLFFDWLMMSSMHLPVRSGREEMIGSTAEVLNWTDGSVQVIWKDEIWQAETERRTSLMPGARVVINNVSGLTLSVKPAEPNVDGSGAHSGDRLQLVEVSDVAGRSEGVFDGHDRRAGSSLNARA